MKIVFPDETACIKSLDDIRPLQRFGECSVYEANPENEEELITRIHNADAVIINLSRITARTMRKCEKLKFVCFLGIGVWTYVNIEEATRRGIWVTNTPNYAGSSVAEHALGLLLSIARKIPQGDRELRQNIWEQRDLQGVELYGKTLGIVGLGPVGARMAELANALGMRVICFTRHPTPQRARKNRVEFTELEVLLEESDFVSLHIASTKETYHLIGRAQFKMMKSSALLVNTARGEVVDIEALCQALETGQIAGAALDVYEEEPLPLNHPLLKLGNVVLTPHIAYNSEEAIERMLQIAIDNVEAFAEGSPLNVVNEEALGGF